ncbi:heme exporter protein CcmD [Catenovulum sp. 2E275]|uniref:heme exporter protein CcmD n=1 Tax=Catenovulum sp. 2E275 TaxID=2980497 RepID=UPI0021D3DB51|nr:heme exporter protein CcmD [Catenovulum sp. 2E275]MCU4675788.1 heme exporter protein CcmD [Catenovulum sp. 2E275]
MGVFESFSDFLNMNGYAFYVWMSYGLTLLLIVVLLIWSKNQRKQVIKEIKQQESVKQARKQHSQSEMSL